MEAFQLLSRGGSFNKSRFKSDVNLFTAKSKQEVSNSPSTTELPPSLDFFKYAKSNSKGNKTQSNAATSTEDTEGTRVGKKRKRDEDEDENEDRKLPAVPLIRHRVTAKGMRVPAQADTFEEMEKRFSISSILMKNIATCNYREPTAIQQSGIPILSEGRDLAAISPTGTGKTLSYLLPLFRKLNVPASKSSEKSGKEGVRALVIAPTRELTTQIHNEVQKLALGRKWRIILFSKAAAAILKDPAVRSKVDIIISTPLRLVASLHAGELTLDNVQFLVLDEADRLLDTEFIEQIEEIVGLCSNPACQKALFSATLPARAEQKAMDMLRDPIRVVVGLKDTPLPNIKQSLVYVAQQESKLPTLIQYLNSPTGYNAPIIVFTSTQARAASLLSELLLGGVKNAEALHAGLTRHEREQCMKRMLQGEIWVLVTTDVLARGMDFGGVQEVINFDWPESVQSYVHRIGRTGRAGREGKAVTYFTDEDGPFLKSIANVILQSGQTVPEWITKLQKPSRLKRRQMGKDQHSIHTVGPKGENVGRSLAVKKSEMIAASQRRKAHLENEEASGQQD